MAYSTRNLFHRVVGAAAASTGVLLLLPGVAGAAFPAINGPIVFQSTRQATGNSCPYSGTNELFTTSAGGGTVSQLDCTGSTDQHPFASPDGTEVLFASNRKDGVDFQLYTMPLLTNGSASGTPVDVSQNLPSGASDDYPSWAPAAPGQQNTIIFDSTRGGGSPELYTENIEDLGSVAPVFTNTASFSDTEPVYDPSNANEIAFVRTAGSGKSQIYTYNFSTKVLVNLSASDGDGNSNDSKPDFAPSPNGGGVQLIVFQSDRATLNAVNGPCVGTQLYTMSDQAGSAITPVFQDMGVQLCATSQWSQSAGAGAKVADENPVFSPDGTKIAFDQLGTDSTQDVFSAYSAPVSGNCVAHVAGLDDLTPNYVTDEAPTWAPVDPGASTPEAPNVLLLPLVGGGVVGAVVFLGRRRRTTS